MVKSFSMRVILAQKAIAILDHDSPGFRDERIGIRVKCYWPSSG